jgi:hypothetical protein
VKSTEGRIFGGFTDLNIDGVGSWIQGQKNSFLFALIDNKIIKCKCINNQNELITHNSAYLIIFGSESLRIYPDNNVNNTSYGAELGTYFE